MAGDLHVTLGDDGESIVLSGDIGRLVYDVPEVRRSMTRLMAQGMTWEEALGHLMEEGAKVLRASTPKDGQHRG